jgi:FixJ family two-component response regulator
MDVFTGGPVLISIVDDDESIRVGLSRLFKALGFDVDVFASGEEFLNSGDLRSSACLVLDLRMPGMDGLELQRRLISSNCQIPIVFLTAHYNEQARAQALTAGAISFLHKPFNEESLISNVHLAVEQYRLNAL